VAFTAAVEHREILIDVRQIGERRAYFPKYMTLWDWKGLPSLLVQD
jgi:hypothetical protein